jgi:hypothetical protein
VAWDGNFLNALTDGGGRRLPLVEDATMGIGSGDASLLLALSTSSQSCQKVRGACWRPTSTLAIVLRV